MGSFIKKDLLVFWRDRKEVLMSLLLPIGIIVVLNLAFSGLFGEGEEDVIIDVGIVQEEDESDGINAFQQKVTALDITEMEKESLVEQATLLSPVRSINQFFQDPELQELVHTRNLSEQEAIALVEDGQLDAFVKIPQGFTEQVLSAILLEEKAEVALTVQYEEESTEVSVLQYIVENFVDSLNYQFALGTISIDTGAEIDLPQGGREMASGAEPYTMAHYFTIVITTLFTLFIASTVAIKTVTEKREQVFNRIVLSNSSPIHYLMGKVISTFIMSWLQIVITFTFIQLFFGVFTGESLKFWIGIIIIMTVYCIAVSGLSALFTPITLRVEDPNAANGIFTVIIMTMGALAGSFIPREFLPQWMQAIGEWTPNGLTHSVLLGWIQFSSFADLIIPILMLIGFFTVCFIVALMLFPRRERV